jgi:putative ABC transport system permease protein
MLYNYLVVAFRSLLKNKLYTLLNLVGLSSGIAVSVLIMLVVSHEYSYDRFHTKEDRIFRMKAKVKWGEQEVQMMAMSAPFGPLLHQERPEVENFVRVREAGRVIVSSDEQHRYFESNFVFADSSLFSVFSFSLIRGSQQALAIPGKVFISESTARRYFNTTDAIGKSLLYNKEYSLEIAGIFSDLPSNSTLQFDFIGSFPSLGQIPEEQQQFTHDRASLGAYITYLLLKPGASSAEIEKAIPALAATSAEEQYLLQPLREIHGDGSYAETANFRNVTVFSLIAVLILAVALVNYTNLTTARATTRAKEVGVRKVIGARRSALSIQFYLESALLTVAAFALALALVQWLMPSLLGVLDQRVDQQFITSPLFITLLSALLLLCIFLAGSYPALVLSRFLPVNVLKGNPGGYQGSWLRKTFTTFQFAVSVGLILCTLVVSGQLSFLKNQQLGLDKEQVMVVNLPAEAATFFQPLKNNLRQLTGVQQVASATIPLYTGGYSMYYTQTPTTHEEVAINVISVDEKFVETLGLVWASAAPDHAGAGNYLVNEAAVSKLKIEGDPIGLKLALGRNDHVISGVVKDFCYESMHSRIDGLVLSVVSDTLRTFGRYGASLYVRFDRTANITEQVAAVKHTYEQLNTGTPFEFYFLDDAFDQLYKSEDRLAKLFTLFSGIGMALACLGLFGLITFSLERRVKEIGIRKVLGASVMHIMRLISGEFAVLFFISVLVAVPAAWWAMEQWLTKFPFRVTISYWMAVVAALLTVLIASITIILKMVRVSRINPADSLRNE